MRREVRVSFRPGGPRAVAPYWPHVRPQLVSWQRAYRLGWISLEEWRASFSRRLAAARKAFVAGGGR